MIQSAANLGFPTPEDMEDGYNTYLGARTPAQTAWLTGTFPGSEWEL